MASRTFTDSQFEVTVHEEQVLAIFAAVEHSIQPSQLWEFMEDTAWPFMEKKLVDRFAYEGDSASGTWPSLSPATVNIKEKLDAEMPDAPNVRTGELMEYITTSHLSSPTSDGAVMVFPDVPSDPIMRRKIEVAQFGDPGPNWLNPAMRPTPARPVIAVDESDMVLMLKALSVHIVSAASMRGTNSVAAQLNGPNLPPS